MFSRDLPHAYCLRVTRRRVDYLIVGYFPEVRRYLTYRSFNDAQRRLQVKTRPE